MKAVGFFLAVFLSMLSVFLVATGEVARWMSPETPGGPSSIPSSSQVSNGGKNMLDFEFWDVKEGRRRFVIRAELNQEALSGTDPIDKLREISLRNGVIELPLERSGAKSEKQNANPKNADPKSDGENLAELVLHFSRAFYQKGDGIAGKKPFSVQLFDGKGVMSDGTEFYFEDLLFRQNEKKKSEFEIKTELPVRISKTPHLDVYGSKGLSGVLTDDGGFERLVFQPPVSTYLEPGVFGVLGVGSDDSKEPAAKRAGAKSAKSKGSRRVAVSCAGPLRLDFHEKPLEKSYPDFEDAKAKERMRITFEKEVVVFEVPPDHDPTKIAKAKGNRFECERLLLEIDTSSGRPVPQYGLALSEGDRVRAFYTRKKDGIRVDGERLEWFRMPGGEPKAGSDADSLPAQGVALLSGKPVFRGSDWVVHSQEAAMKPSQDFVELKGVRGTFQRLREATKKAPVKAKPNAKRAGPSGPQFREIVFRSDTAEVYFKREQKGGDKTLSHFVAKSETPRGVVVEAEEAIEPSEDAPNSSPEKRQFRALG
ncbi:MAG: hypothetical protein AAF517_27920, partial [Planctomycetota bacterium]